MLTLEQAIEHCHEKGEELREEVSRCKREFTGFDNKEAIEAFQKTVCENRLYCPARPKGEWRDNLIEVFRQSAEVGGDMFHLSEIERIINGEPI